MTIFTCLFGVDIAFVASGSAYRRGGVPRHADAPERIHIAGVLA